MDTLWGCVDCILCYDGVPELQAGRLSKYVLIMTQGKLWNSNYKIICISEKSDVSLLMHGDTEYNIEGN